MFCLSNETHTHTQNNNNITNDLGPIRLCLRPSLLSLTQDKLCQSIWLLLSWLFCTNLLQLHEKNPNVQGTLRVNFQQNLSLQLHLSKGLTSSFFLNLGFEWEVSCFFLEFQEHSSFHLQHNKLTLLKLISRYVKQISQIYTYNKILKAGRTK